MQKGRNESLCKPKGDVLKGGMEIMPWSEVSQVVLQPVPAALLFYPYSHVYKTGFDPKWETQGVTAHFPAPNTRVLVEEITESASEEFFQPGSHLVGK